MNGLRPVPTPRAPGTVRVAPTPEHFVEIARNVISHVRRKRALQKPPRGGLAQASVT